MPQSQVGAAAVPFRMSAQFVCLVALSLNQSGPSSLQVAADDADDELLGDLLNDSVTGQVYYASVGIYVAHSANQ